MTQLTKFAAIDPNTQIGIRNMALQSAITFNKEISDTLENVLDNAEVIISFLLNGGRDIEIEGTEAPEVSVEQPASQIIAA